MKNHLYNNKTATNARMNIFNLIFGFNSCIRGYKLFILLVLLFSACELTVPVELPEQDPKIVLNSVMGADSLFAAHVSKSLTIAQNSNNQNIVALENAEVLLFENGQKVDSLIFDAGRGIYFAKNTTAGSGKQYRMEVKAAGLPDVWAEMTLPEEVKADSVRLFKHVRSSTNGGYESDLKFYFKDNPDIDNYYVLILTAIDSFGYQDDLCFKTNDRVLVNASNGDFFEDAAGEIFYCGEVFFDDLLLDKNQQELTFTFDDAYLNPNTVAIEISLVNLTEAFYKYTISSELQYWNFDNPFAQPVIVYNNIQNGFGIFGGFNFDPVIIPY
jgi:uncharacterized protein DUF4249